MRISIDEPQVEVVEKTEESIERESVRKTFRGERKKLKSMTPPERLRYLWTYYKLHAAVILLVIIVAAYLTHFFLTQKECVLMGVAINDTGLNIPAFERDLADYLSLADDQNVDLVESVNLVYSPSTQITNANYNGQTQLICYVAAKQLDFAFGNQDGMEYLASMGACRLIEDVLPEDLYAAFQDRVVCFTVKDTSIDAGADEAAGEPLPVALDLTGSRIADYFGFHNAKTYLCFTALSGHDEELQGFVRFLYELESGEP